jgi:hypothetical protein
MKSHFPTSISLGNLAVLQIVSSIHPSNGNGINLFETTSLILGGIEFGDSTDTEIAGVTASDLVGHAERFSAMAKDKTASRKKITLQLGSNFDAYWFQVQQSSFSTLSFDVSNRAGERLLSTHKVPLDYFLLLCNCYYNFVQSFKKLYRVRKAE